MESFAIQTTVLFFSVILTTFRPLYIPAFFRGLFYMRFCSNQYNHLVCFTPKISVVVHTGILQGCIYSVLFYSSHHVHPVCYLHNVSSSAVCHICFSIDVRKFIVFLFLITFRSLYSPVFFTGLSLYSVAFSEFRN